MVTISPPTEAELKALVFADDAAQRVAALGLMPPWDEFSAKARRGLFAGADAHRDGDLERLLGAAAMVYAALIEARMQLGEPRQEGGVADDVICALAAMTKLDAHRDRWWKREEADGTA